VQKSVLEFLEAAVSAVPDKIIFADPKTELTYAEFSDQAKRVGSELIRQTGGSRRRPVAVLVDRSVAPLAAFFGTVYSGNFYVPIDRRMPPERVRVILETLQAETMIAEHKDERFLSALQYQGRILYLEELLDGPADQQALDLVAQGRLDTDPVYATFTSGSTGVPKGVLVCHRSVIDLVDQFHEELGLDENSVHGNQAPYDFDGSVKDIYSTIRNHATMYVIPQMMFSFPAKLIEYLNAKKINTIIWAASALRIVENLKGFASEHPRYLTNIMFTGEALPVKVLNYWKQYLPDAQYINLYGPTEITCNCTYYRVDREFAEDEALPIGVPFRNTGIFLLDGDKEVTMPESQGEICVRGSCLALGYYNNPDKTSEAFCQNPLNTAYPERIYRTGDIGKYDAQGRLYFISRKDAQIKHMGHRIELGEIEVAVNALDFVEAGVCMFDGQDIFLCYQAETSCEKEILRALGKKLPPYMFPTKLVWYEKLPLNSHNKIDRVRLRQEVTGK
jgi:amino acid adenylation domain-containing protein